MLVGGTALWLWQVRQEWMLSTGARVVSERPEWSCVGAHCFHALPFDV